jgi:L-alanine-DL-glutamate epimerase-like enolase superfamily enzyme
MIITDVNAFAVRMPFTLTDLPASLRPERTTVIVKVSTDEGVDGFGESFGFFDSAMTTVAAVETMLKPMLTGEDPSGIQKLWDRMYRNLYYTGRMGIGISAVSGVEIALWDILGKAVGAPVFKLLGGRAHDELRAYASLMRYPEPGDVARACGAMVERGYTAIKLHEIEVPAVKAARETVGDKVDLLLDVNCQWDVTDAIRMGRLFEPFNLYWYEEPVWPGDDYRGLSEVRKRLNIPLAAGENEYTARAFENLVAGKAVDFLQPSVYKLGGIIQEKKVFTLAETMGARVMPHCISFGPAMAATLHVCFSEPGSELVETSVDIPETDILREPLAPENGYWKISGKPGLGIEVDENVIERYRMR